MNEEIKRLNEQRAAFSPIPLKDQIKELDRLMARLDGRVQRLKILSDKTSLPERIARAITSLFHRTKDLLSVRTQDEAKRALSAAERDTKAERQKARYGKTYRASLYERMAEMRENIQIIETKQKQHQKYAAFVSLIERRVEAIRPTLKTSSLSVKSEWKATVSPQPIHTKIVAEAMQKRDNLPLEYRPSIKLEPLTKNFKAVLAGSASLVAITTPAKPTAVLILPADYRRPKELFTTATITSLKDNAARSVWHKEVTVRIKSLDAIRATRTPIAIKDPMESSKVWSIGVSNKAKAILQRMQADIRERKAQMPRLNMNGFSGRFNNPTRTATDAEVIQKVRTEAKADRAKVPPDMRAKMYFYGTSSEVRQGFSDIWKNARQIESQKKNETMRSKFTRVTKLTGVSKPINLFSFEGT